MTGRWHDGWSDANLLCMNPDRFSTPWFRRTFLTLLVTAGLVSGAAAALIVDFSYDGSLGDVSTSRSLDTDIDALQRYNFNADPSSGQGGFMVGAGSPAIPATSQWNFSGGAQVAGDGGGDDDVNFNRAGLWENSSTQRDDLQFAAVNSGTGDFTIDAVILWDQTQFGNGGSTQTVGFNAGSSITLTVGDVGIQSLDDADVRFVVNDGGTYYITEALTDAATPMTFSLSDPNAADWATFSPSATDFTIAGNIDSGFATRTFADIQSVGYAFSHSAPSGQRYSASDFEVNAVLVPEPATATLLLAGVGVVGWLLLRRRWVCV